LCLGTQIAVINVASTDFRLMSGSGFVIMGGALHSVKAEQRFKMIITMISGSEKYPRLGIVSYLNKV